MNECLDSRHQNSSELALKSRWNRRIRSWSSVHSPLYQHQVSLVTHLFLTIGFRQTHLAKHLRSLLHHQCSLVRVGADIAVMLKRLTVTCHDIRRNLTLNRRASESDVYHLHHLHLSLNTQMIEECGQVLLHLNRVVLHLCHGEDTHTTLTPHLKHATSSSSTQWRDGQQKTETDL